MPASDLVSIGIPTYGRADRLERAVRSVLAQDHRELELIVADDASTDDTPQTCARLAAEDSRVRVVRHERNLGHARNFRCVFELATGPWFMWLSDDDWIDPRYVSRCLGVLQTDPGAVLVGGRARYYDGERFVAQERATNLRSPRAAARVARYFARVDLNGPLYGIARHETLRRAPFEAVIGGDWLVVGQLAALGTVQTLEDVHVNRSATGLSSDSHALTSGEFGLTGFDARQHHVLIARTVAGRIVRGEGTFGAIGRAPLRALVALVSAGAILARFSLLGIVRRGLDRFGLLPAARRLIAPLRAARHR